jgi:hypothetical protein
MAAIKSAAAKTTEKKETKGTKGSKSAAPAAKEKSLGELTSALADLKNSLISNRPLIPNSFQTLKSLLIR